VSEQPTTTLALAFERPTVEVDAQEWAEVSELMLSMEMTEREGGLSALELRVSNVSSESDGRTALAFEDDSILKLGARIAIYAGDVVSPREIFRGTITGVEADFPAEDSPTLLVFAEDEFQRARMARRTKLHDNATIAGLAADLASQVGLTPVVTGLAADVGPQLQLNESDLAFLRRLLVRYDADMQVVGTELHVSPRGDVSRGTIDLELHGQLRRARVLADLAHQTTEVTVSGWDAKQGSAVAGSGAGAHLGPGTGRTGAAILREAIGARSHHLSHLATATQDEAQAVADAAFDARARRFVIAEGTTDGNAALRVGTTVTLRGLGGRFENDYYVTLARHRWDERRGYQTDFTAECAFLGTGGQGA
jgi:phage protein D